MRSAYLAAIFLAFGACALAEEPTYLNAFSVDAMAAAQKIASRPVAQLKTDTEKLDWARARLAWIALLRLQGREEDALRVFSGCAKLCQKHGPEQEWAAVRAWGCGQKKEALPCASKAKK